MAILGSATYKLTADHTGLRRGLRDGETMVKQWRDRARGIMVGGLAIGGAILAPLGLAARAASDLAESQNAVNVVFGEGSKTILDFSKNASAMVGLARSDFNQLSATTGALFTNFGLSEKEAADATIDLTKRAADLASVFNTDVNDALQALQAGIRGETEPLRRFAADVTDATLEMYLMEKGINRNVSEMSQAEKGLLRFEVAMEQTSKVQGDFSNTSGSAANASRILKAQVKDAAATIGMGLLPVVEEVLPWLQHIVTQFQEWAGNNPKLMRALVVAIGAIGVLALGIGALGAAVFAATFAWPALAGAIAFLFNPVTLAALAFVALGVALALLVLNFDTIQEWFDGLPLWAQAAAVAVTAFLAVFVVGPITSWAAATLLALKVWKGQAIGQLVAFRVFWVQYHAMLLLESAKAWGVWIARTIASFVVWAARMGLQLASFVLRSAIAFGLWMTSSIAAFALWIAQTLLMFGTWAIAMGAKFLLALGPAGLILLAIAGFIAAGYLMYKHWETIAGFFGQMWENVKQNTIDKINRIIEAINKLIAMINRIPVLPDIPGIPKIGSTGGIGTVNEPDAEGGGGKSIAAQVGNAVLGTLTRGLIKPFAAGGIVTGPTVGLVGESGPEAVVPLNRAGGLGGVTVHVHMDGATVLQASDAEEYVVDMVDRAVRRGVRLGGV